MARLANSTNARSANVTSQMTVNHAGGQAYKLNAKLELVSLLLANFMVGDLYRKQEDVPKRVAELAAQINEKDFLARAALYARNEFGMRTMSHILAGEIADKGYASGTDWGRDFFNSIIYRVDDMMEIMGYYLDKNPLKKGAKKHALPNALKAGFAEAFSRFDPYQLAKYRGESHAVKLVDVVRLVRPKPTAKNAEALKMLLEGTLKNVDTWESKVSAAGQVKDSKEKESARADAWASLLKERKLGYLALVRNLANIAKDADDATFDLALEALVNRDSIKKSLILPFQLYVAYREIENAGRVGNASRQAKIVDALSQAMDIAVDNVPKLEGKTLVAIDVSGSMDSRLSDMGSARIVDVATLFGVVLAKANDAEVILFDDHGKYVAVPKSRSILDNVRNLARTGGGTSFEAIFHTINKEYDTVIILSDMQAWMGATGGSLNGIWKKYNKNGDKFLVSWDLNGHGTSQFPEKSVATLAGWSEKVFDILKLAKTDKAALVKIIEAYEIKPARGVRK